MPETHRNWERAVQSLRDDPGSVELVRACFYDDPIASAAERFFESTEWRETMGLLPTPGRALEIGAGRGIASYALARCGWKVTALEPDPSAIVGAAAIRELSMASGWPIEVIEQWGETLPFVDKSFDLVYCRAVLHHARDLHILCKEAFRVLKEGGTFLAVRDHVISLRDDLPTFLAAHPLHRLYGGENAFLLGEYLEAILNAGLQIVRTLGPFSSDINLFPDTKAGLKCRIGRRLHLPGFLPIPDLALRIFDWHTDAPGRHYSFVARKPAGRTP